MALYFAGGVLEGESKQKTFYLPSFLPNHEPTFTMGRRCEEPDHGQVWRTLGTEPVGVGGSGVTGQEETVQ